MDNTKREYCEECGAPFSHENVRTEQGQKRANEYGICENCFEEDATYHTGGCQE